MKKKTKLIGYIIGIILFVSTIAGFTYAMYRKSLYNVNINGIAKNLDEYIIYSKGVNISSGTLNPVSSYTGGSSATVTFYKKSDTPYVIYGHIYLDINSMSPALSHELKYTVIDDSTSNVISEGTFYTYSSGDNLLAAYNIPLNNTTTTYTVYVWVDEDFYDSNTASSSFDIDIRCYATMKPITGNNLNINFPRVHNAANYIKYMYDRSDKSTATVNSITYNLAPDVNLMNDRHASMSTDINGGDIRYYGANPNNYAWLGDTYASSFTTDETSKSREAGDKKLWRIIGVFDGRLKLISNDPISVCLNWDRSANNVNGGQGINQWGPSGNYEGADLMRLLNPGYENESINNSLYWTKGTGTVYSNYNNSSTTTVSYANTGLSASEKALIDTATWYTGAYNQNSYVDAHYIAERGTMGKLCSSGTYCNDNIARTSTWNGKVGLIYASDYGYSADLSRCDRKIGTYVTGCVGTYWLKYKWNYTISPYAYSSSSYGVLAFDRDGSFMATQASACRWVRSAIYIKSSVLITDGTGTETYPYVLNLP